MKYQLDLFHYDKPYAEFGTKVRIIKLSNTYMIVYTLKIVSNC